MPGLFKYSSSLILGHIVPENIYVCFCSTLESSTNLKLFWIHYFFACSLSELINSANNSNSTRGMAWFLKILRWKLSTISGLQYMFPLFLPLLSGRFFFFFSFWSILSHDPLRALGSISKSLTWVSPTSLKCKSLGDKRFKQSE